MEKSSISWAPLRSGDIENSKSSVWFKSYQVSDDEIIRAIEKGVWSPCVWKDGYRAKRNFLFSDLGALDFDKEGTLASIEKIFCDSWYILATTKSHQKEKISGKTVCPPRDRFRLILKWEKRITDCYEFEKNLENLVDDYGADTQADDGAHFFYPSTLYSSNISRDAYLQPVKKFEQPKIDYLKLKERRDHRFKHGVFSGKTLAFFINDYPIGARHERVLAVALELAWAGFSIDDAVSKILNSPTFRNKPDSLDFQKDIKNAVATITDAYRFVTKCINNQPVKK